SRYAEAGRAEDALATLRRLEALAFWNFPLDDEDFSKLTNFAEYREIAAHFAAREPRADKSAPGFVIAEKGLKPGGIAYDAALAGDHLLNDLAFDERGTLFVTDSNSGELHMLVPAVDQLLPFFERGTFPGANGIALSDARPRIFVAHSRGISIVDRTTKAVRRL